jgi:hypothetical protein
MTFKKRKLRHNKVLVNRRKFPVKKVWDASRKALKKCYLRRLEVRKARRAEQAHQAIQDNLLRGDQGGNPGTTGQGNRLEQLTALIAELEASGKRPGESRGSFQRRLDTLETELNLLRRNEERYVVTEEVYIHTPVRKPSWRTRWGTSIRKKDVPRAHRTDEFDWDYL